MKKYLRTYYNIINRAFLENRSRTDSTFYEAHHIKPRSMYKKSRLVLLTAREHYIVHFLLYKHFKANNNKNGTIKMGHAWHLMTFQSSDNIKRYTSHSFSLARIAKSKAMSGENHHMFGKMHTDETRYKIKSALLEMSDEWRENASNNMRAVQANMTPEQRGKQKKAVAESAKLRCGENHPMFGKEHSEKSKQNMSNASIGKSKSDSHSTNIRNAILNQPKVECPHCSKVGALRNMTRWHFDNCKLKKNIV